MVLLSLFVGIIITSMELLKEGIKEEKEVWTKVKVKQKQYNMRDATINNLLEIFDLIDIGENGKLTVSY
jgi:phage pi2 protein 07